MRAWIVALLFITGPFAFAEQPVVSASPQPLPDKLVMAWKDAGATVGWMKVDENGHLAFVEQPAAGAVPAFRFAQWKDGVVPKLPVPAVPFGLYLSKAEVQDSGLRELAALKTLTELCLCETEVTAEAVEALQKLLPKCFILNC